MEMPFVSDCYFPSVDLRLCKWLDQAIGDTDRVGQPAD